MKDTIKNLVNRYDDLISTLQAGFVPLLLSFAAFGLLGCSSIQD